MIALIQRVSEAQVKVDNQIVGQIDTGLLALLGMVREDTELQAAQLIKRLLNYRVFVDHNGKMNRSLLQVSGSLLLVPQFTLAANTGKGLRPGFDNATPPTQARALFETAAESARAALGEQLQLGRFGADMAVALVNDGPVTFWLESTP